MGFCLILFSFFGFRMLHIHDMMPKKISVLRIENVCLVSSNMQASQTQENPSSYLSTTYESAITFPCKKTNDQEKLNVMFLSNIFILFSKKHSKFSQKNGFIIRVAHTLIMVDYNSKTHGHRSLPLPNAVCF